MIAGYETFTCPRKCLDVEVFEAIEAFFQYRSGHLPFPGTWLEQPAKAMTVITRIGVELAKYEKEGEPKWSKVGLTSTSR